MAPKPHPILRIVAPGVRLTPLGAALLALAVALPGGVVVAIIDWCL